MVNAAFRLPEVSLRHLHRLWLENPSEMTPESLVEEIQWRERSHNIDPHSGYSSQSSGTIGIPPNDAEYVPPVVDAIEPGTIASFPLRMTHADTYIGLDERGSRTALLGDAAHTTHPLAGQGLNMGLADAKALADCITSAVKVGGDIGEYNTRRRGLFLIALIGSITALQPYSRTRYFENHKLLSAVDKLHKLYSSTASPIVWSRSVGLEIVNELDTLKAAIMASAGADFHGTEKSIGKESNAFMDNAAKAVNLAGGVYDTANFAQKLTKDIVSSSLSFLANTYGRR